MNFCMQVGMDLGYLLSKNHGASCWDKKVLAKSVPNLLRAAALTHLEILKKIYHQQNFWVLSYIFCSYSFSL